MSQRDTMKPFRKAVHQVINGNVVYNLNTINAYDKKVFTGQTPNLYILYGTQRESLVEKNDCTWIHKGSIEVLIISKTPSEVTSDVLDEISDKIYELVLNLPGSDNLAAQSGFQIVNVERESATLGVLDISPTESHLTKIFTLTATIIQQN